jgi:hypothetical protein
MRQRHKWPNSIFTKAGIFPPSVLPGRLVKINLELARAAPKLALVNSNLGYFWSDQITVANGMPNYSITKDLFLSTAK